MVGKQRSQKNKRVIVNTRPFESLYLFALMKYFLVTFDRRYFWGSSKVVCLYFKSPKARVMVQEVFSSATSCYHKHISRWHVSGEILPKSRRQFSVLETPDSSPLKWQHSQACVRSTFSGCLLIPTKSSTRISFSQLPSSVISVTRTPSYLQWRCSWTSKISGHI